MQCENRPPKEIPTKNDELKMIFAYIMNFVARSHTAEPPQTNHRSRRPPPFPSAAAGQHRPVFSTPHGPALSVSARCRPAVYRRSSVRCTRTPPPPPAAIGQALASHRPQQMGRGWRGGGCGGLLHPPRPAPLPSRPAPVGGLARGAGWPHGPPAPPSSAASPHARLDLLKNWSSPAIVVCGVLRPACCCAACCVLRAACCVLRAA